MSTPTLYIEITDTFGGDANYSWVRRVNVPYAGNGSKRSITRAIAAVAGWTGCVARSEDIGDHVAVYPRGACMVAFGHVEYL